LFFGGRGKVWQIVFGGDLLILAILVAVGRDVVPRLEPHKRQGESVCRVMFDDATSWPFSVAH
jgi:hypothetical protein